MFSTSSGLRYAGRKTYSVISDLGRSPAQCSAAALRSHALVLVALGRLNENKAPLKQTSAARAVGERSPLRMPSKQGLEQRRQSLIRTTSTRSRR
jgi:hypothetical protein